VDSDEIPFEGHKSFVGEVESSGKAERRGSEERTGKVCLDLCIRLFFLKT
jgi:hypothetical protein